MTTLSPRQPPSAAMTAAAEAAEIMIAPIPRVSIQAFCEDQDIASVIQVAGQDRRMAKTHLKVQMGGAAAAVEAYKNAPTPNLVIIQTEESYEQLLVRLEELSQVCDPGTKLIIIGSINDIVLYRELMNRGVSDYLIAPIDTLTLVSSISNLFTGSGSKPIGRVIAVMGAKGGVGASTIAHNLAFMISKEIRLDTVIADLDLPFGTTGLDFNQDPPQGIADAVFAPDRIDSTLIDRLLSKCAEHLSILAAPATLDRMYDFSAEAFDPIFDVLRASIPYVVLDVPHMWTAWSKKAVAGADAILIVATPDLASLRNAKNLVDHLRSVRPNDTPPFIILNQTGMPKRPEIKTSDFARALDMQPIATIPFDAHLFGTAANNGQMIAEISATHRTTENFRQVAQQLTGRSENKKGQKFSFRPLLERLKLKA